MIEVLAGSPAENVLAVKAVGKITADDYEKTLNPALEDQLAKSDGLRVVLVLGEEWEGLTVEALWEDLKTGLSSFRKWKRCAVVTDRSWVEHATKAFGWMAPGGVKVFELDEIPDAMAWAAASD